jgi:hypothetical protein
VDRRRAGDRDHAARPRVRAAGDDSPAADHPAGATQIDVLVAAPGGVWTAAGAALADGMAGFQPGALSWYPLHFCAVPVGNTDPYLCNRERENSTLVRQRADERVPAVSARA